MLFMDVRIVQLVSPVSDDVPFIVNSEERYIESPFLGDVISTSGRLSDKLLKVFPLIVKSSIKVEVELKT